MRFPLALRASNTGESRNGPLRARGVRAFRRAGDRRATANPCFVRVPGFGPYRVPRVSVIKNLMANAVADVDLLTRNDARGDDFTKPRVVDFCIVSADAERAALIRDFVNEHPYGEAAVEASATNIVCSWVY
jgi:hypothetical protein